MSNYGFGTIIREYGRRSASTARLIPLHFIVILLNGLLEASPPAVLGFVVDQLLNQKFGFLKSPLFIAVILAASGLYFLLRFVSGYWSAVVSETACAQYQKELYRHLQKLSADFYQRTRVGEITARLTNDVNKGIRPFYGILTESFWQICLLLFAAAYLFAASRIMFLFFFGLLAVDFVLSRIYIPRVEKGFQDLQEEYGSLNASLVEKVAAHSLIRAFAREKHIEEETKTRVLDLKEKQFKAESFLFRFYVFFWTFHYVFAQFAILLFGALALGHGLTMGGLVAAFAYWKMISERIDGLLFNITNFFTSLAGTSRVLDFFRETPLVFDRLSATVLPAGPGGIEFRDASFAYPSRNDGFSIDRVSFSVPAGLKTALVGRSGSGKSTLVQLLLRIYDLNAGRIGIDGVDIASVTQESLRSRMGCVMQETLLLNGTVRDNLLFVRREAGDERIVRALEAAGLGDFLRETPDGLETVIGEKGVQLSGGQKQRLAIARVFLLDPSIVILDEATSSLDAVTEHTILRTMNALLLHRTSLVISHRIGTVMDAHRIVVLDGGCVQDAGTHDELAASNGIYRSLCLQQGVKVS